MDCRVVSDASGLFCRPAAKSAGRFDSSMEFSDVDLRLRRVLAPLPTLLAVITLCYLLLHLTPRRSV
jgi:hypothetical protein